MKDRTDTYVFISYASSDRQLALELYQRLSKYHRLTCWMDAFDIPVDELDFQEHILRGIRNASALMVVKTEQAEKSLYVAREVAAAKSAGVPIFKYRGSSLGTSNAFGKIPKFTDPASEVKKGSTPLHGTPFIHRLRIAWLASRIKLRITQPFWLSTLILGGLLLAMGVGIFFLTRAITPVVADTIQRRLPEAVSTAEVIEILDPVSDPKIVAPFYFAPDYFILQDDFEVVGVLDEIHYPYDIRPKYPGVTIYQEENSLHLYYPNDCLLEGNRWDCETEIHSQRIDFTVVEYFGFRAKSMENTDRKEISFSISVPGPRRWRTGFGWAFSDHVTPFFRSASNLPEEDFYAYLPLDDAWHVYEIILNPETALLSFYLDGQQIECLELKYYGEWLQAPLMLIIYADAVETISPDDLEQFPGSSLEIDEVLVGGFE